MKIKVGRVANCIGARWCDPIGWDPETPESLQDCIWRDGAWWDDDEEVAAMIVYDDGDLKTGQIVEREIKDIAVLRFQQLISVKEQIENGL